MRPRKVVNAESSELDDMARKAKPEGRNRAWYHEYRAGPEGLLRPDALTAGGTLSSDGALSSRLTCMFETEPVAGAGPAVGGTKCCPDAAAVRLSAVSASWSFGFSSRMR